MSDVQEQSVRMWPKGEPTEHPSNVFEIDLARTPSVSYLRVIRMGQSTLRLVLEISGTSITAWFNGEGDPLDQIRNTVRWHTTLDDE